MKAKAGRKSRCSVDETLEATEKLLEQPLSVELAELAKALYYGPHEGLVNGLVSAALRVARGAVEDGASMAVMMATPYTQQKKRDADPRVVEVIDVVEKILEGDGSVIHRARIGDILLGDDCQLFEGEWSHNSIVSVVRAYTREASEDELYRMVEDARKVMTMWARRERENAADARSAGAR